MMLRRVMILVVFVGVFVAVTIGAANAGTTYPNPPPSSVVTVAPNPPVSPVRLIPPATETRGLAFTGGDLAGLAAIGAGALGAGVLVARRSRARTT